MSVCTRFAPSPTGYLHIGGARTALYSWLYARQNQGRFVLRIEDTDRERSTQASVQAILDAMDWLDLDYDTGPLYQTQNYDRYNEVIEQLLQQGKAYRCYCSKERLNALREEQIKNKQKPRYDGLCRNKDEHQTDAPFVIRFRNPLDGVVVIEDLIRGHIEIKNKELDDLIIKRSDGNPTYNFTVVVDDMDMGITHVIRGDDHINNTPRQINILKALGATIPYYAHVPMILGKDGKRLSKRHGAVSVLQYREDGYLPHALLNYLIRLGWAYGDQEIFSRQEMIELFDIKTVNKAGAIFNDEKLLWLNHHYIKTLDPNIIAEHLAWHMQQLNIDISQGPALNDIISVQAQRCKTLKEMAQNSRAFFMDFASYDESAAAKFLNSDSIEVLKYLLDALRALDDWSNDALLSDIVKSAAQKFDLKLPKIAQPLRVALTGNTISPSIDATLRLMGKSRVIERLQRAIEYIA